MPKAHQRARGVDAVADRPAGRARSARRPRELVDAILAERPHPEQGYRSCLGILRLGKRYGDERLEAACARALAAGARSYRHVESILKHGSIALPLPTPSPTSRRSRHARCHENVRGRDYYNN